MPDVENVCFVVGGFECDAVAKNVVNGKWFVNIDCNFFPKCVYRNPAAYGVGVAIGRSVGSKV